MYARYSRAILAACLGGSLTLLPAPHTILQVQVAPRVFVIA